MNSGLMWEQKSKQLLKDLIEKRIRSIIGVSMEAVENNIREERPFSNVRFVILKVCNDIMKKLHLDVDGFTIKKDRFEYEVKFGKEIQ